jgi:replicative DNA helicase
MTDLDTNLWAGFDRQPADGILADGRPIGDRSAERATTFDHDAEAAVLGACLLDPRILDELPPLTVADFHKPQHGLVWESIQDMHDDGTKIDPVTVAAHMHDAGTLMRAGGGPFLHDLMQAVPTAANGSYYALRVAEMTRRRDLTVFAARASRITATPIDADAQLDELRRQLDLLDSDDSDDGPVHWNDMITEGLNAIEESGNPELNRGIATGLGDLDALLKGLRPGDVIIVAGRPGSGKSTLVTQIATHAALDNKLPTLVCSLEMRRPEIYNRIVSARLSIPLKNLNTGILDDTEWTKLAVQAGVTSEAPLWFDDNTSHTLTSISGLARRWKRRHGLKLLAIDYLQLIGTGPAENRQAAVSELSRKLKVLAFQLDIPIVLAAQLNRGPEQRADKVPMISDLRESGSIENDASVIILVHREEASDPKTIRKGEADLIVAKHRHGPQGVIPVAAQLHLSRFASMAGQDFYGRR